MKENEFLFRLGALLTPALLASPSVREAALVAISTFFLLILFHGFASLFEKGVRRLARPSRETDFAVEAARLLVIALLASLADHAAARFCAGARNEMGFFFPVVLVNVLLLLKRESLEAKGRIYLWFAFGLLAASFLKTIGYGEAASLPAGVFFFSGFFLFALGWCVKKKWAVVPA